jgi:carnitine O-acetyltransferase
MVSFVEAILDPPPAGRSGEPAGGVPEFAPVRFVLDEPLRAEIKSASEAFAAHAAGTASATVSIENFTSERAKQLGVSPDAFAQLAFQLAHARAKGFVGATYESIATRGFHHGRTEAMRVITPEMLAFVDAMQMPDADAATKAAAARSAARSHAARAKACQAGQAPEQHLWELQLIQRRRGEELGATAPMGLYGSPGWRIMRSDYLSTSAVPSPLVKYFGFGSTSRSCIGVGYALMPDRFDLYLSTPREVAEQMYRFADELRTTITELDRLLATA